MALPRSRLKNLFKIEIILGVFLLGLPNLIQSKNLHQLSQPKISANKFLINHSRQKRNNDGFFEESTQKANLERECNEELCNGPNHEEFKEATKNFDAAKKDKEFKRYFNRCQFAREFPNELGKNEKACGGQKIGIRCTNVYKGFSCGCKVRLGFKLYANTECCHETEEFNKETRKCSCGEGKEYGPVNENGVKTCVDKPKEPEVITPEPIVTTTEAPEITTKHVPIPKFDTTTKPMITNPTCSEFEYLENGQCKAYECHCINGVSLEKCTSETRGHCQICDDKFVFDEKMQFCVEPPKIECSCENGTGKIECDQFNDAENCDSCDEGFQLEDNVCMEIVVECPCENGTGKTECFSLSMVEKCSSCDAGFELEADTSSCVEIPVECPCENGTGEIKCVSNDMLENCSICNDGFNLEGLFCVPEPEPVSIIEKCPCENGVGKEECDSSFNYLDWYQNCGTCNSGFQLQGKKCVEIPKPKECHCSHGIGKIECFDNSMTENCKSCLSGYELRGRSCVELPKAKPAKCTCENGHPDLDKECQPNQEWCLRCYGPQPVLKYNRVKGFEEKVCEKVYAWLGAQLFVFFSFGFSRVLPIRKLLI